MRNPAGVLIVEDEFLIATTIAEMVEVIGHRVVAITDEAEAAVAEAMRHRPTLVLMDIRLIGNRDGVWAAEQILGRIACSIVFVTGSAEEETIRRAWNSGASAVLLKPIGMSDLEHAITKALHR